MTQKVLIVGAGITGLCTGLTLVNDGYDVTIVERDVPQNGYEGFELG